MFRSNVIRRFLSSLPHQASQLRIPAQGESDLPHDLPVQRGHLDGARLKSLRFCDLHPPLVDHMIIFFLQFQKHRVAGALLRNAVAAKPQFLFVEGFFDGSSDHPAGRRVVVETLDQASPVGVRRHLSEEQRLEMLILYGIHQKFEFISFEYHLFFAHVHSSSAFDTSPLPVQCVYLTHTI